jgi:hypothetical protein
MLHELEPSCRRTNGARAGWTRMADPPRLDGRKGDNRDLAHDRGAVVHRARTRQVERERVGSGRGRGDDYPVPVRGAESFRRAAPIFEVPRRLQADCDGDPQRPDAEHRPRNKSYASCLTRAKGGGKNDGPGNKCSHNVSRQEIVGTGDGERERRDHGTEGDGSGEEGTVPFPHVSAQKEEYERGQREEDGDYAEKEGSRGVFTYEKDGRHLEHPVAERHVRNPCGPSMGTLVKSKREQRDGRRCDCSHSDGDRRPAHGIHKPHGFRGHEKPREIVRGHRKGRSHRPQDDDVCALLSQGTDEKKERQRRKDDQERVRARVLGVRNEKRIYCNERRCDDAYAT